MPVRIKVTIFFAVIGFAILFLVCAGVYYFSYVNRAKNFDVRLANRAVTTARFLARSEIFNRELIQTIDAATAAAMTDKTTQAFDLDDNRIYSYAEKTGDTIPITKNIIDEAKTNQYVYFTVGNRDAVAYHHNHNNNHFIIITAAYDAEGKKTCSNCCTFCGFAL